MRAKSIQRTRSAGIIATIRPLLRRPDFHSIQTRLPLGVTLLLAIAIAAAMVFAYFEVRRAAVFAVQDRLERVTKQVVDIFQENVSKTKDEMQQSAQSPELRRFLALPSAENKRQALSALEAVRGKSPTIVDVELWDDRGEKRISVGPATSPLPPTIKRDLLTPLARGEPAVIGALHLVADVPVFVVAAAVTGNGRAIGYLLERGRLSQSPTAARSIGSLIGSAATIYVGNIQRDLWSDFWLRVDAPPARPIKPGKVFQYRRTGTDSGFKYALEKAVPGTPWLLLVEFPADTVLAPVTKFVQHASAFAIVLLVIGAIGLSTVSRNITRPLNDLRRSAIAITEGDYSHRLDLGRKDELGQLARAFDTMATRVAQAQTKLQRQLMTIEGQYHVLVDGIKDYAIVMLDASGNVVSWNKGAERINGYRSDEILGQHFSRFYLQADIAARVPWLHLEIASTNGRSEGEGWRIRKDGSLLWVSAVIAALRDERGDLIGFAKVSSDITERKRLAENEAAHTAALVRANTDLDRHRHRLKAANSELEAFTYSVSHDLRAPIRRIEGFSKILGEHLGENANPQVQSYLNRIQEGSHEMRRLVDDLLQLAKLGRQQAKPEAVALGSVARDVVGTLSQEAGDRDIEWRVAQLPTLVCDAGLMKIVFTNLLSNAVKYTRPRQKALIEIGQMVDDGQPVVFVRDNGVGFDMNYADKLFGVFQRLHRVEDFEGTGVGLATVQRIIRKHNGRIWADATPDQGATFFFTLQGDTAEEQPEIT
jgi:PAS domain S-box-containing protein